jgi:hypothetical protein
MGLGLEFEFTYYIVPTLFYILVLGNKMGCGYFCLKLLHTIVASKFGTRIIIMSITFGDGIRGPSFPFSMWIESKHGAYFANIFPGKLFA